MGLGFSFMLEGIKMMSQSWLLGGFALLGTLLLLTNRAVPVMFLLLVVGAIAAVVENPVLLEELGNLSTDFRLPRFALADMTWKEFLIGTVFLALPQVPLTLGNAVIAVTEENNRLFPDRPVTEKKVSISTGIMNLLGPAIGAVPMCQVRREDRWGARHTGRCSRHHRTGFQRLGRNHTQDFSRPHTRRHSISYGRAARFGILRVR
jgi:hypothetical protein